MTTERDVDRRIGAWLDVMSSEAPDWVIDAVLQAAETTPQVRRRLRAGPWRSDTMNRIVLVAAAAALGVAVIGGVLFTAGRLPPGEPSLGVASAEASVAPSPSIAPSASPSPSSGLDPIPSELLGRWMGSPREGVTVDAGVLLTFDAAKWAMSPSNRNTDLLARGPAGGAANELVLAEAPADGCPTAGRYQWNLSPSGRVLEINPIEDGCAARANLVSGTYWRSDCKDPMTNCLGDLDPGTYASQYITPLASAADVWSPVFGGLDYTVPDGWANWSDWPGLFGLTPSSDYAATAADDIDPANWIQVLRDAQPESQASACSGTPQSGIKPTPEAFLAWLRTVPGLAVGEAQPIAVNGHAGAYADIGVDDSTLVPCGGDLAVEFMIAGDYPQAILAGERQRLILLDNGNGGLVAIQLHASTAQDFAAFAEAAMPIVETMRLK